MSAGCKDAPLDVERRGVQLEDIEITEKLLVRIEEFVIVDLGVLPEDPLAARLVIGLRGTSLDLIAESILALIGVRQIGIIQPDERARQQKSSQQKWKRNSVQA